MRAMNLAINDAELQPDDISYINAHGTSTSLNDKTETLAIKKVFGDQAYQIPVSSNKSMIGHLLGATGAVELVATTLSINNYEVPDPLCDLDYVPNNAREYDINNALSNSFGFGGHNVCICIKKFV